MMPGLKTRGDGLGDFLAGDTVQFLAGTSLDDLQLDCAGGYMASGETSLDFSVHCRFHFRAVSP